MPGRMGSDTITIRNLSVVAIDQVNNTITVKGPIPGAKNSLVRLTVTKRSPAKVKETPAENQDK